MITNRNETKRILVCPLDWGLGHATRCIPIIHKFISAGFQVHLAGGPHVLKVLSHEFPNLPQHALPEFSPRYSKHKRLLFPFLALQSPRLLFRVMKENREIKRIIKQHHIQAIISDNRFGTFRLKIPSFYLTHQIKLEVPKSIRHFANLFSWGHQYYIKQHTLCFIVDEPSPDNLAGSMSDVQLKNPSQHLGLVTRFGEEDSTEGNSILIVLSGQEPQRSLFEQKILEQIPAIDEKFILVRGLPLSDAHPVTAPKNCSIIEYASTQQLKQLIAQSKLIISRSGYTSVLDWVGLQKQAILVPTPGQTEQEYLAKYLKNKGWFYAQDQDELSLSQAIGEAHKFHPPKLKANSRLEAMVKTVSDYIQ